MHLRLRVPLISTPMAKSASQDEMLALLNWFQAMGVDAAVDDTAQDWLARGPQRAGGRLCLAGAATRRQRAGRRRMRSARRRGPSGRPGPGGSGTAAQPPSRARPRRHAARGERSRNRRAAHRARGQFARRTRSGATELRWLRPQSDGDEALLLPGRAAAPT